MNKESFLCHGDISSDLVTLLQKKRSYQEENYPKWKPAYTYRPTGFFPLEILLINNNIQFFYLFTFIYYISIHIKYIVK